MIAKMISGPPKQLYRCYTVSTLSSATITPPVLLRIRNDMKAAMKARDSNRLSVLRSLLTQALNASKTSSPINTDLQMLTVLRKTAHESRAASIEFRVAGREDLAEKEEVQLKIIEEYAATVKTLGEEEIMNVVRGVIDRMKINGMKLHVGEVLKCVFAPESLGGKPVERVEVAKFVRQFLASANS